MQLCDHFRMLVDKAVTLTPDLTIPLIESRYAAELASVRPAQPFEALDALIRTALTPATPEGLSFQQFRALLKSLKFQSLSGLPIQPYADLAHRLLQATRMEYCAAFSDEPAWIKAIEAARACDVIHGPLTNPDFRITAVLDAAKRLTAEGYPVFVENDVLSLSEADFGRLCTDLEDGIRAIGGRIVLRQLFYCLRQHGQYQLDRYIPGRAFTLNARLPSLPAGYLLNLGAKHLTAKLTRDHRQAATIWKRITDRARDLCALYDVEPYHHVEDLMLPASGVPGYLSSIALFDHLFTFRQWRPSEARELIAGLLDFVDEAETQRLLGWSLQDALNLTAFALKAAGGRDMVTFTEKGIVRAGLNFELWQNMRPWFVHALGAVNSNYVAPLNADKADLLFKPFIAIPENQLLLVTPSIGALAFYEAITRALRAVSYPSLEDAIGHALERVVARKFQAHGANVTVQGDTYTMRDPISGAKQKGQCDVVLESTDRIVFVETKKKAQQRVSATGNPITNLLDLSASLFDAQRQLARHERILLYNKHIDFEKTGYRLEHNGRKIERIAITTLDFGAMQDKFLLHLLFNALAGAQVIVPGLDPDTEEKLSKLNRNAQQLHKECEQLKALGRPDWALFKNCWFLSVSQLYLLLDGLKTAGEFEQRLDKLKGFTYQMRDFYREFCIARKNGFI